MISENLALQAHIDGKLGEYSQEVVETVAQASSLLSQNI